MTFMSKGFEDAKYWLVATCVIMSVILAMQIKTRERQIAAKALIYKFMHTFDSS